MTITREELESGLNARPSCISNFFALPPVCVQLLQEELADINTRKPGAKVTLTALLREIVCRHFVIQFNPLIGDAVFNRGAPFPSAITAEEFDKRRIEQRTSRTNCVALQPIIMQAIQEEIERMERQDPHGFGSYNLSSCLGGIIILYHCAKFGIIVKASPAPPST